MAPVEATSPRARGLGIAESRPDQKDKNAQPQPRGRATSAHLEAHEKGEDSTTGDLVGISLPRFGGSRAAQFIFNFFRPGKGILALIKETATPTGTGFSRQPSVLGLDFLFQDLKLCA
jgi:hypothetical protein